MLCDLFVVMILLSFVVFTTVELSAAHFYEKFIIEHKIDANVYLIDALNVSNGI